MKTILPKSVIDLHLLFTAHGKKLFVVGGAVRDFILGQTPKDFDLCTDALPSEVVAILKDYRVSMVGSAFGIVIVFPDDQPEGLEIATFRADISKGRNPEVKLGVTIEEDCQRRDLTINAMFYDIETDKIIDLVGGISDIKDKITRMVGDPLERFEEDSLRILRIGRFSARYETVLDKSLISALKQRGILANIDPITGEMKRISQERIWEEIKKAFKQVKTFDVYLKFFTDFDLWEEIFPKAIINKSIEKCEFFETYIACLFKTDGGVDFEKRLVLEYKIETEIARKIIFLKSLMALSADTAFDLYKQKLRTKTSDELIKDWLNVCGISDDKFDKFNTYVPTTFSQALMDLGFSGKELGDEIKRIEVEKFNAL